MAIQVGKAIYSILSGDTTIHSYVQDKIYPIFAPDETVNPFIVYELKGINTYYTKDGFCYDEATVIINTISDSYSECINIADAIRKVLELVQGTFGSVEISQCLLSNYTQTYGIDGYIISLEFTITC